MDWGNVTKSVNGLIYYLHTQNAAGPQSNEDVVDTSAPRLSHPARKQVCDFIRILLMDSLINIPAKDQHHPFIQLLEVSRDSYQSPTQTHANLLFKLWIQMQDQMNK